MRTPMELQDSIKTWPVESRPGKLITPPYVHKLIKQISEAIQEEQLELFDPSFDKSYTFDISISIQEARALIEFNTLLNGPIDGFTAYDEGGSPIL